MAHPRLSIGAQGPDFHLLGVDGKTYSVAEFRDKKILVVMFTCNHCPYVQAYEDRLIAIQKDYAEKGVALVAINPNETKNYPEDSFPHMVKRATEKGYNFPYLRDEGQSVADAYGASYTPEVFVLDKERRLRYTGQIDDNYQNPAQVKSRDLRDALDALLEGRPIKTPETQGRGCSVKWLP